VFIQRVESVSVFRSVTVFVFRRFLKSVRFSVSIFQEKNSVSVRLSVFTWRQHSLLCRALY